MKKRSTIDCGFYFWPDTIERPSGNSRSIDYSNNAGGIVKHREMSYVPILCIIFIKMQHQQNIWPRRPVFATDISTTILVDAFHINNMINEQVYGSNYSIDNKLKNKKDYVITYIQSKCLHFYRYCLLI